METIKGQFAIKATPLELGDAEKRLGATRMMFEKRFSAMNRGKPEQTIVVVPDSGTNELVGLSGRMTIEIANGEHFFTFAYSLGQ